MVRIILMLVVLLFSNMSYSAQCQALNTNLKVVLANGMNTEDIKTAQRNARKIVSKIKILYKEKKISNISEDNIKNLSYELAFNVKEGDFEQIKEVYNQYVNALSYDIFVEWFSGKVLNLSDDEMTKIKTIYNEDMARRLSIIDSNDQNFQQHESMYKRLLEVENRKLIIFAHSQGNLYTDAMYRYYLSLISGASNKYKILSLGSPNAITDNPPYLMDDNDWIRLLAGAPTANINNKEFDGLLNTNLAHSYDSYMYGSHSSKVMDEYLIDFIESFDYGFSDSAVTITLDKGGNDNLHLGVYEASTLWSIPYFATSNADPSGAMFNSIGSIETKNGKDIYTVKCNLLPESEMIINGGVWNSGNSKESATVTVATVDGVSKTKTYEVDGTGSDNTYQGVNGVIISVDDNGNISFTY